MRGRWEIARHKLVAAAEHCGIALRQTFGKEGKTLRRKAGGYAHACQFKPLKRVFKRQRTRVAKLIREVRGKLAAGPVNEQANAMSLASLATPMERADRIRTQQPKDRNKFYALEVECVSKGKARNRYEFGVKGESGGHAQARPDGGIRRFTGNPYNGHTLKAQQLSIRLLDTPIQNLSLPNPPARVPYSPCFAG